MYSVKDLHEALSVNERTIRDWFKKRKLKGVKLGTEWHISEENLAHFLNADREGDNTQNQLRIKW